MMTPKGKNATRPRALVCAIHHIAFVEKATLLPEIDNDAKHVQVCQECLARDRAHVQRLLSLSRRGSSRSKQAADSGFEA